MDKVESYKPNDLTLFLRSARSEAQDYVTNLDEENSKRNAVLMSPMTDFQAVTQAAPTWKRRLRNSFAKALFTLQIW